MIAILTGDIVGSQDLSPAERDQLQANLEEAAGSTELTTNFEVFAGDSWQCLCHPPYSAIRLAATLRAYLLGKKGIDTRISIGIGAYERIRPEKLSLSHGEAFVLSGRGLKEMPERRRLDIRFGDDLSRPNQAFISAALLLLDGITSSWTAKQAQAVVLASSDAKQYELAKRFDPPISAQAFGKHLASAQWKLVKQALDSLELGLTLAGNEP